MTITVAKDVEEFLQAQARAEGRADAGELINDLVRSLRELHRRPLELTPELEANLLEAADQPATPLTQADFDRIRERVRARTSSGS